MPKGGYCTGSAAKLRVYGRFPPWVLETAARWRNGFRSPKRRIERLTVDKPAREGLSVGLASEEHTEREKSLRVSDESGLFKHTNLEILMESA